MRKTCLGLLIFLLLGMPQLFAQKRVEAGVFVDYLDVSQTTTNNFGLGARFGYRVHRDVMLEGELAYDYGINFGETYRNLANGNIAAIENTSVGVTHVLFGAKLQPAGGGFRPFITLKGGFMDFRLSPGLLPLSDAVSTLLGLRTSNLNAAIYPAAGVEAAIGRAVQWYVTNGYVAAKYSPPGRRGVGALAKNSSKAREAALSATPPQRGRE